MTAVALRSVADTAATLFVVSPLFSQYFQKIQPMTAQRQVTTTCARHDTGTIYRPHTIASITLESGSAKRTVQRWLAKCGDIGLLSNGTRYFSDAEKAQILSHQRKPVQPAEEEVEAELIEPGSIELHTGDSATAAPLVAFNIESIQITLKSCDTSALDMQSAQFEQVSAMSASAIANAISAELIGGIAQVRAKQKNLVAGIEAQALANVAKALSGEATGK